jgi:hypothetical protein
MSYLRYLYLFEYSGVQHILCCVFVLFVFVLCTLYCQFVWILQATDGLVVSVDLVAHVRGIPC